MIGKVRELQEAIKARDEAIKARNEAMDDCVKADNAKLEAEEKLKEEMKAADERVRAAQRQAESVMEELDKLKEKVKNSKDEKKIKELKEELRVTKERLKNEEATKKGFMDTAFKEQKAQEEEIERLKKELAAAESKAPEMTEAAKAEIKILKAKLEDAQKTAGDEEAVKFKIQFQNVQVEFYGLMDTVDKIKDETARAKRKHAIKVLLEEMREEVDK
ncbi:MAG: hypothetical protein IJV12_00430 [Acidaminococcaceae bacterium]|nr:hypothetical protein [Acidaminococcaceae bacterium]